MAIRQGVAMPQDDSQAARPESYVYYRHKLPVRIMHWVNVVALTIMFMTGLQIFNAHSQLYWGKSSYDGTAAVLAISSRVDDQGRVTGYTRVFGHEFDTTGALGASKSADGRTVRAAFPWWITIPGMKWLSMARSWHFFFAWVFLVNGIAFVLYAIFSRHLARDLAPTGGDLKGIGASIKDHLLFRHPSGEAAKRYNVLQKFAYLIVIFGLLPLIILMGFAMSPMLDSLFAGWVDLFGGRQAARTIHFVVAWLLVAFVLIHVFEVIITGLWNNLRSMITGRFRITTQMRREAGRE
jgi:thiosulfate reductase cytochrome b subunit